MQLLCIGEVKINKVFINFKNHTLLISLMGNLGMFGGNIPPIPVDTIHSGGKSNFESDRNDLDREKRKKRILQDDNEILSILKIWVQCQK